jgi:hypothetical protein
MTALLETPVAHPTAWMPRGSDMRVDHNQSGGPTCATGHSVAEANGMLRNG